jgi:pimeloyl-ACP methyl ester carboxylesterase
VKQILGILVIAILLASCSSAQSSSQAQVEQAVNATMMAFQSATLGSTLTPTHPIPSRLTVTYLNGQTFILWPERTDLQGEKYRVYRFSQPITPYTFAQAALLGEVGKDSARFYANRYKDRKTLIWTDRFVDRYIIQDFGSQVPVGTGLLVWTLDSSDFGGAASGDGYYAITVTSLSGNESLDPAYRAGPIPEAVADPSPVEITSASNMTLSEGAHIFIQYMDLRNWNPTFHTPNPGNDYYGLDPNTPGVADDLQYAYDYLVYVPTEAKCGGDLPDKLPVIINLHGYRGNVYVNNLPQTEKYCAYVILPQDESDTWWFGFAQKHDYRTGGEVGAGDTIVNYTEQRVLRMLFDLERKPIGPAVDTERVYVDGQSMGATGALAFAERYPNVFAAAYASQPVADFLTAGDTIHQPFVQWGNPDLNLPVLIDAPEGWATPLQKYNGVGVWDWQNYQENLSGTGILSERLYDDMTPIGIVLGTNDHVINWSTQGPPTYAAFNASQRAWGGLVTDDDHQWMYYIGMPPALAPLGSRNKYTWIPYWNFKVVKDETVPGFSNLSDDSIDENYNQTINWSSSWYSWDGSPIDQANLWQISICTARIYDNYCGNGGTSTVDVTPRRVQQFKFAPGATYTWENRLVSDNSLVASGTVTADSGGLVVIKGFLVTPGGDRLVIKPAP